MSASTEFLRFRGREIPVIRRNTVIVGSGAAGFNCADCLCSLGQENIAIVTEGINMGTSRNTGSDKQTYYKLSLSSDSPDSVYAMAQTLFDGGAMHGDLALVEAAGSVRAFMKLVELGCPFPSNEFGEFVGYKTDHDPRARATSCGPLTSKFMTERLQAHVESRGVVIFDGMRAAELLRSRDGSVCGLLAVGVTDARPVIFAAKNVVWATGGPSAIYEATVYPESQTCAVGVALEAGAAGINLTESQYGIASLAFRWNLSGTYQQVIPRYISTEPDGSDEHEFLPDYIHDPSDMFSSVFLKGYQWPFDPRKLGAGGSSRVDMAIYAERSRGRRVFLDFTREAAGFDFSLLSGEARDYLSRSGALCETPISRLAVMNSPAIALYRAHGIDLYSEPLEIDVCAQHNNGGLAVNTDYESVSLPGLFAAGEVSGVFGVYRPGGSALNSTQVGSMRAARRIARDRRGEPEFPDPETSRLLPMLGTAVSADGTTREDLLAARRLYGRRMSRTAAFIRNRASLEAALEECLHDLGGLALTRAADAPALTELLINRDILLTQRVYIASILEYISHGGGSRGSYLVTGGAEPPSELTREVCLSYLLPDGSVGFRWEPVRPIPRGEQWFEKVYNDCLRG